MIRIRTIPAAFLLAVSASLGCSDGGPNSSEVTGSLEYNGQPIRAGSMKFHTADGVAYSAQISDDGTYSALDLPAGEMTVTIETESINPNRQGATDPAAKAREEKMKGFQQPRPSDVGGPDVGELYIKIPEKYGDPKTSPLKVTLDGGGTSHDFELTD